MNNNMETPPHNSAENNENYSEIEKETVESLLEQMSEEELRGLVRFLLGIEKEQSLDPKFKKNLERIVETFESQGEELSHSQRRSLEKAREVLEGDNIQKDA